MVKPFKTGDTMIEKDFEKFFKIADEAQQEGDFVKALDNIEKCIEIEPENVHCLFSRALILAELDRADESLEVFEEIIEIDDPEFASMLHYVYYSIGMIYDEMEVIDKALENFNRCIKLKPDFAEAHYQKGVCLFDIEENNKALESLNKALELESDYFEAVFARGHVYVEIGEIKKALEDFNFIIKGKQNIDEDSAVFLSRAMCFFELEEFDKALTDLNKCLEIDPDEVEAYSYRSHVYEKLGEIEKSKADLKKFEELVKKFQY